MRFEFLMAGSPNDAFYSQAAMFRRSLDALGAPYRDARLVLCLVSGDGPVPTPERWSPWFERIEVRWADPRHAFRLSHGQELFDMVHAEADLSVICDADTIFVRPLPEEFLREMASTPAICGVVAHFPPSTHSFDEHLPLKDAKEMWEKMGAALGRAIALTVPYSLPSGDALAPSFYINHAFLAAPPDLMRRLGKLQAEVRPALESVLTNQFDDQIAVALAVELGSLPHRRLPLRFNFPNDTTADQAYPDEVGSIVFLHYLRLETFDRHTIFAVKSAFERFMALPLEGSNLVFQDAVRRLTGGAYPFEA